jgi:hypothetical protein
MDGAISSPRQTQRRPSAETRSPVPRWVVWSAMLVPLTVLPSGIWRIVLGVGIPVGFTGELAETLAAPGWITLYVIMLSAFTEAAAYLAVGLVRPWGEVFPAWVPRLRGRTVPVMAAVIPAVLGVIGLSYFCVVSALAWNSPENMGDPDSPHGFAGFVMTCVYAPMLAWPALLAVVTVAYYRRRRRDGAPLWSSNG